jgi:arylsulfatase A-like enzyme
MFSEKINMNWQQEQFVSRALTVCCSAFFICQGSVAAAVEKRPNVVVIYVDDLDLDELGVLGSKQLMTPNIDKLARDGMMFRQGYVTSSICTPSRFGMLTGNYACRSVPLQIEPSSSWRNRCFPEGGPGNIHFNAILAPGQKTVANYLQDAGYTTGIVGKWHLGRGPKGYKEKKLWIPKDVDPESAEGQAKIGAFYKQCTDYVKANYGFDYVDGFYVNNARALPSVGYPKSCGEHNPEWMTAKAREFIEANKGRPFYLYYALTLPHGEGNSLIKTLENADPYLTPVGRLNELPDSGMPPRETIFQRLEKAMLPTSSCGMLWVDDAVGALLAKLDECGVADNTVVFFLSDHGNYAKEALYDGGARVPCFVKWPGVIPPGAESEQIVANIDVAPTILEIAGAPQPDVFDGKSILSILKGNDAPVRDHLLLEVGYGRAVVSRDWKYIALRFPEFELPEIERQGGLQNVNYNADSASANFRIKGTQTYPNHYYDFDQLYDLNRDPNEQKNLFGNPEYASKIKQMQTLLRAELEKMPHTFGEIRP